MYTAITLVISTLPACAAKHDIRGVETGMTYAVAASALQKIGAQCKDGDQFHLDCSIQDGADANAIDVFFGDGGRAYKIEYVFYLHEKNAYQIQTYLEGKYRLGGSIQHGANGIIIYSSVDGGEIGASFQSIGSKAALVFLDKRFESKSTMPKF